MAGAEQSAGGAVPPWRDQCSGRSVGAMDSNDEKAAQPNSDPNTLACSGPSGAAGGARASGSWGAKSSRRGAFPGPVGYWFTAGQPLPCW